MVSLAGLEVIVDSLSLHTHEGMDSKSKTLKIRGDGKVYNKAWGGSKNIEYNNLSSLAGSNFRINLTERVGGNIWYRGLLGGKAVWIHSSYLVDEGSISKLGHIKDNSVQIHSSIYNNSHIKKAGKRYTNRVYYIKKKASVKGENFYLLSKKPSANSGLIGWVKASEVSTHQHAGVDSNSKTFYFNGKGSAYTTAWGGKKDLLYKDLSKFRMHKFNVQLTEKVGHNIWYRGRFNGKTIWLHESFVTSKTEKHTSRLGHLRSEDVEIYNEIGNKETSFIAGEKYINVAYYIKQQAKVANELYYLISNKPSSVNGGVGWVKAADLSTHRHTGVDSRAKTYYFTGSGRAYTKAWGGSKDLVYQDMMQSKGQRFNVHLTETVGSNTWYRGNFNGKTIWLHESYVATKELSSTSKLGHLRSGAKIFATVGVKSSMFSAEPYLNAVYYIKNQTTFNNQTYYLISKQPSSSHGVVGWVNASDLMINQHIGVDRQRKNHHINGKGNAYTKAWGGSRDLVFSDMSKYKGEEFSVHLTESVGSNIWYRGKFHGKTIWLHNSFVE